MARKFIHLTRIILCAFIRGDFDESTHSYWGNQIGVGN